MGCLNRELLVSVAQGIGLALGLFVVGCLAAFRLTVAVSLVVSVLALAALWCDLLARIPWGHW